MTRWDSEGGRGWGAEGDGDEMRRVTEMGCGRSTLYHCVCDSYNRIIRVYPDLFNEIQCNTRM